MQLIKHGFSIKSEVLEITSIKPGGSGTMEGRDYPASTKFRTINIIEDAFENTIKEVEEIVEYNIPCASNAEATQVTDLLRNLRSKKLPVFVNTSMPKLYQGSQVYTAKSLDHGKAFIQLNNTHSKESK